MDDSFVIFPTNEIVSIFISLACKRCGEVRSEMVESMHSYISDKFGLDLPERVELSLVENDGDCCHLALPYYESLRRAQAQRLDDRDMVVSGGEILNGLDSLLRATNLAWEICDLIKDNVIDIYHPHAINMRLAVEEVRAGNSALSHLMSGLYRHVDGDITDNFSAVSD